MQAAPTDEPLVDLPTLLADCWGSVGESVGRGDVAEVLGKAVLVIVPGKDTDVDERIGLILLKKYELLVVRLPDSVLSSGGDLAMMGRRQVAQGALFYEFSLEHHVPGDHILRSIDRFVDLSFADGRNCRGGGRAVHPTSGRNLQKLDDEDAPTAAIIELASKYGRYGCRGTTALVRRDS